MRLADARADFQSGGAFRTLLYTLVSLMISISILGLILRIGGLNVLWLMAIPLVVIILLVKSSILGRAAIFLSFIQINSNVQNGQHVRMASDFVRLNSGRLRLRARNLQRLLTTGNSLAASLESSRIARTAHEALCCRAVDRYGPRAISELPNTMQPLRIQSEVERLMSRLTVIPWLMQGILIVLLMVVSVFPTIEQVQAEFFVIQDSSLRLSSFRGLMEFPYNVTILLMVLIGIALSACIISFLAVPQLIHIFPFRYLFHAYHRSVGLISLTIAGNYESNLQDACRVASELVPSPHFSRRLELIADRISQGKSPQTALVELFVLTRNEAAFVGTAINAHSLAWAVQQIAVAQVERMLLRFSAFTQFAIIVCVLFFAAFYGTFAYFLFGVISQMILNLS